MEAPARSAKALQHLHGGFRVIGVPTTRAKALLAKMALDSIPKVRTQLIDQLADGMTRSTQTLADQTSYPTETRRALETLPHIRLSCVRQS